MLTESPNPIVRSVVLAAALLIGVASVASAAVRDEAHFFSDDAVRQANDAIAQIRRDYGKDLAIETYASAPDPIRQAVKTPREKELWNDWLRKRMSEENVNGVLVLITREPAHIQAGVDSDTGKQAFIKSDHEKLTSMLASDFREGQFDRGLQRAVEQVRTTLSQSIGSRGGAGAAGGVDGSSARARDPGGVMAAPGRSSDAGSGQPTPPDSAARSSESPSQQQQPPAANVPVEPGAAPSRGMGLGSMLCLIVGAVIALGLIARLISRRQSTSGPMPGGYGGAGYGGGYGAAPGYPPTTGGGMGRGFLGGLLGGLLGGAAYNRWTRGSSDASSIYNDPGRHGLSEPMPAGSDPSQDFASSSGADFGDAGGGDPGGGGTSGADFGGGDVGGGDVGGGGGDVGGGDAGGSSGADF